jgi:anti-sigma factor RsiW
MTAITCAQLVELVTDYLEGELDELTARRFEEHLALCPGCRTYVEQFRQVIQAAGQVAEDDLSWQARTHLLAAFRGWRER